MFNLGGMEILVIVVVALLVLGPEKLPKVMRTIGKTVGDLRRASTEFQRTVNLEIDSADDNPAPTLTKSAHPDINSTATEPHRNPDPTQHMAEAAPEMPTSEPSPKRVSIPRAKLTRRPRPRRRSNHTTNTP